MDKNAGPAIMEHVLVVQSKKVTLKSCATSRSKFSKRKRLISLLALLLASCGSYMPVKVT